MRRAGELLYNLRAAPTAAAARHALSALEDDLTPSQLADLLPELDRLSGLARLAWEPSDIIRELREADPQPYVRRDLAADAALFSTPSPAPRDKSLIVALCGRSYRLMVPWSLFLQFLPASRFDVVILADRSNNDYFTGVGDYATDLWSLVKRTLSDVGASRYRRLYCYGASVGGLAALRFGVLAGAHRSISVGGTLTWPIYRLQSGQSLPAYEPICACSSEHRGHVVCVHASDARHDRAAAMHVQQILKVSRIPINGIKRHNIVYMIYRAGGLPVFNAELFDFDPALVNVRMRRADGSLGSPAAGAADAPS